MLNPAAELTLRTCSAEHASALLLQNSLHDVPRPINADACATQAWEGEGVVASFRKLVGATNPLSAEPGTIRGDFGRVTGRNIVHASDSPENGVREAGAQTVAQPVVAVCRVFSPMSQVCVCALL
jgi:nucleoside-diphosphate kinase